MPRKSRTDEVKEPEAPKTETVLAMLPERLVDRARALFDQSVQCLKDVGLDDVESALIIEAWAEGLQPEVEEDDDE